jgi:hypothetical protein
MRLTSSYKGNNCSGLRIVCVTSPRLVWSIRE